MSQPESGLHHPRLNNGLQVLSDTIHKLSHKLSVGRVV